MALIVNDRAKPIYPRRQKNLPSWFLELVDSKVREAAARERSTERFS